VGTVSLYPRFGRMSRKGCGRSLRIRICTGAERCCSVSRAQPAERVGRAQAHRDRIGLNTGPVNVGNRGSPKRLAWTVMGDNVNHASRLEGMTKEYRIRIVISEATYRQVAHQFICRDLDRIRVKGKLQPVGIYEVLDVAENGARFAALLKGFNDAMKAHRGQEWQEAAGKFGVLLTSYPDDGPTQIFLQRALDFMERIPIGWRVRYEDQVADPYFSKFLQWRPSCSSRASASFGPHVPAG
jgi:Adenylate and Guanylate cyclase catalytic domain